MNATPTQRQRTAAERPIVRWLLAAGVVAVGVVTLVGSGGGTLGFPPLGPIDPAPPTGTPSASVSPERITAQVGSTVTLAAVANNLAAPISYRWCRVAAGSSSCVDIAGATTTTLTLTGVNLADDGAAYRFTATSGANSAQAVARLVVSSTPGVVHSDGNFTPEDWAVLVTSTPAAGGPTAAVTRLTTGGSPDAYRSVTLNTGSTTLASTLRVSNTALNAVYQPATQGAVHAIDFALDCIVSGTNTGAGAAQVVPMLEQSGRLYQASAAHRRGCLATWLRWNSMNSLVASEFERVEGPACGLAEACPDFGPNAAPLRLGYGVTVNWPAGTSAAVAVGVDNWRATVWRR